MHIRVAFYNIHSGLDDAGAPSWQRLADWVRLNSIDVCGVVEVEGTVEAGKVDWLVELGRAAGMGYLAYGECFGFDYTVTGHGTFGNGVLSRVPLKSEENLLLTPVSLLWDGENPESEPRCALRVVFDSGYGAPPTFFVTHFPYGADGAARKQAARSLASAIAQANGPVVVAGDFNAELDSEELQALQSLDLASRPTRTPTYPTGSADREIDLVLVRGAGIGSYSVDTTATMSDHYPVLVDILFE